MKICMLYHHPFDVLKRDSRVLKEARSLKNAGHDITILYGGKKNICETEILAFDIKIKCVAAWQDVKLWWFLLSKFDSGLKKIGINTLQRGLVLVSQGERLNADAYHAHDVHTLKAGYILKKRTRAELIYDSHEFVTESNFMNGLNSFSREMVTKMEKKLASRADCVITVTDSIAQSMSKRMEIKLPVVVRNFPLFIENIRQPIDIRTKLDLARDKKIAIYAGLISEGRGIDKIVEVAKNMPDVEFVLIGPNYMNKPIEHVKNLHVQEPVQPHEIVPWLASADIGLSVIENINLSYYYSLPNKVGEYIMAGIPIVVSDFPEMREIALENDVGLVFDPESPEDIARAIRELLEPETYARKKKNVMEARKRHCWENEESVLIKLYNDICSKK